MSQYIFVIIWLAFMSLIFYFKKSKATITDESIISNGTPKNSEPIVLCFIAFFPIIVIAATRGYIGDTLNYELAYKNLPADFSQLPDVFITYKKDVGFYFFAAIFKNLTGFDYRIWFWVIALFQGLTLVYFFRKYSSSFTVSVFLFVASTDYISWMLNGVRQFMAVCIVLYGTKFFISKKYIPSILVIVFASAFHQSALIMLPILYIALGKFNNKKTWIYLILVFISIFFLDNFTSVLDNLLSGTQYHNVVSDYTEWGDDGTNPFRVAVYCVPAILCFIGRNTINNFDNPLIHFCANLSIASAGLYIVSMFTSGIFIGRLPIYCSLYGYIVLPWIIKNHFNINDRRILYFFMIILYIIFYFYQIHIMGDLI